MKLEPTSRWTAVLLAVILSHAASTFAADLPELHDGPAVWLEEYWDVKPEHLAAFVQAYRRDVYSLARHIPGYRGYTVLTNLPDPEFPSRPNLFGEKMIAPHYGVHLQGRVQTERVINIGNLWRRTHNLVIAHHLQSWNDAESFRARLEEAHAKRHPGTTLTEHLGKTLFPLANNYFEATFRLITTGLPLDAGVAGGGPDADGLHLEPRPSQTAWFKEYFEVDAEQLPAFLDAYNETFAVMRPIPGYRGVTIITTVPPGDDEARRTGYKGQTLGGSSEFYESKPGLLMDGTVRTDTSINFAALFRKTYTIITYFEAPWGTPLLDQMQKNWEALGNRGDRLQHVTKRLFPHARNHWDMQYRPIESSFVPLETSDGQKKAPATGLARPAGSPLLGTWEADLRESSFSGRSPYRSGRISFRSTGAAVQATCDIVTAGGAQFHFEYVSPEDGSFVPVSGNPYYDSASVQWVDGRTAARTERRGGKVIGVTRMVVAQDGESFTATSSRETPEGRPYLSTILWRRTSY